MPLIILIFIIFTMLVLLSRVRIEITYKRLNEDDKLSIILKFLKIKFYEFEISMIDISKGEKGYGFKLKANKFKKAPEDEGHGFIHFKTIKNIYNDFKNYYRLYTETLNSTRKSLIRGSKVERFEINAEIGVFDNALTGISSGLIYALLWNIYCLIANNIKTEKHEIFVKPRFDINIFKLDLYCIFTIRIGNIIYVVISLAILYIIHLILNRKKFKKSDINLNIN